MMSFIKEHKKPIALIVGIIFGATVLFAGSCTDALQPLDGRAVGALAVLAACIPLWVGSVLPEFVTALIMCVLFIAACDVPTEVAFSAFASPTWWLLVAAFSLGLGMQRSGLMKRIALAVLRVFPNTFKMQVAGLIAAGTLVGPLIPSLAAKAVMLAPLSMGISDSMGYERKSREASGLFLAAFTGMRNIAPAVISASIIGYALVALLPSDVAADFNMLTWFVDMLPWFIFVSIANYIAIIAIYSPKKKDGSPTEHVREDRKVSEKALEKMPKETHERTPMSASEKRLSVIMLGCIVLWVTEPLHQIPSHVVAISAMILMIALKIVSAKDLKQGVAWDSLIFIGCVLGLASVFSHLGIDEWIVSACKPAFMALAGNPYLFILSICIITILLRFVIVSETAYVNIFMAFMVPISIGLGMNPWVIGVSVYAVVNPWFVLYQNSIYMTAFYATEGKMVIQSEMAKYCLLYLLICIAGLMVSIPFWQLLGLL